MGYERPGAIIPRGLDEYLSYTLSGTLQSAWSLITEGQRLPLLQINTPHTFLPPESHGLIMDWVKKHKPDVVFSSDYFHLCEIQDSLLRQGIEFEALALDNSPRFGGGGINLNQEQLGRAAVDLVVAQMNRGESGIPEFQRTVHVGASWKDVSSRQEIRIEALAS